MSEQEQAKGRIKITLVRSPIGIQPKHKLCLRGLGLRRVRHTVELEDTPAVRGMIRKVDYLLAVGNE